MKTGAGQAGMRTGQWMRISHCVLWAMSWLFQAALSASQSCSSSPGKLIYGSTAVASLLSDILFRLDCSQLKWGIVSWHRVIDCLGGTDKALTEKRLVERLLNFLTKCSFHLSLSLSRCLWIVLHHSGLWPLRCLVQGERRNSTGHVPFLSPVRTGLCILSVMCTVTCCMFRTEYNKSAGSFYWRGREKTGRFLDF